MPGLETPPLSLYVHLPWCVRKCPYCDFNSHQLLEPLPEAAYLEALGRDLDRELEDSAPRPVETVFFGGGTPSLFGAASIGSVLERLDRAGRLVPAAEVTLEANPGTVERGSFAGYRAAGVNRVSLGAQSFDAGALRRLGRIHGPDEILAAVEELRAAGLENFNLDLMYGLPGQDPDRALADLEAALACGPAHLSWYQLTIEPNTRFWHARPALPGEDAVAAMQEAGASRLAGAGFEQYEVSAWARPGRRCAHNLNYWSYGDYLGVGAGAHGKLSAPGTGRVRRRCKPRRPAEYLEGRGLGIAGSTEVAPADLSFEFMLNALRLKEGFVPELYRRRTGLDPAGLEAILGAARARGLVEDAGGRVRPSALGWRFLNDLQGMFLPEREDDRLSAC